MIRPIFLLLLAALIAGCRKPEIHSYVAQKDATLDATAPAPAAEAMPQLS